MITTQNKQTRQRQQLNTKKEMNIHQTTKIHINKTTYITNRTNTYTHTPYKKNEQMDNNCFCSFYLFLHKGK